MAVIDGIDRIDGVVRRTVSMADLGLEGSVHQNSLRRMR
jgi:hypothetical protein